MNPTTTAPASFLVFDDKGRVWPPGFVSSTCDPDSPHTMLSVADQARERTLRRRQAAERGRVKPAAATS